MPKPFFRTRRFIKADNFLSSIWFILISLLVLVAWFLWFFLYPVDVYKTSPQAHIEMESSPATITTSLDGTIKSINLEAQQKVEKGTVLVTLDDEEIRLVLKELEALYKEARTDASFAKEEYTRWQKLYEQKLMPEIDFLRAKAKKEKLEDAALALKAKKELLELTLKKHEIVAPIAGVVGSVTELRPGALVKQGEKLGTIMPKGSYKVVAYFKPADAIGHIKAYQQARMKLDGFSWTQYGMIYAQVKNVANEVVGEGIKVEFYVAHKKNTKIPYQHGLTGAIEVLVDRLTPAELVLSKVGKFFSLQKAGK
jgi:RND family efflux transporter MFP subunit